MIEQAFRDWLTNRAYIDNNGNYRVKDSTRGSPNCGPIAPWNKTIKKHFKDHDAFHKSALAYEENIQTIQDEMGYDHAYEYDAMYAHEKSPAECPWCGDDGPDVDYCFACGERFKLIS